MGHDPVGLGWGRWLFDDGHFGIWVANPKMSVLMSRSLNEKTVTSYPRLLGHLGDVISHHGVPFLVPSIHNAAK